MKKIWVYLLGLISGIVLTGIVMFLLITIYNVKNDPGYQMINGITFFEEPGDIIAENSFEVFQALGDGSALANGKYARQIGLYRYTTKMDIEKTVPVVEIMDK